MKRRAFLVLPLLAPAASHAQAFAPVAPGRALSFPRDHGAHPDYRIEWWYITGWLDDGGGQEVGFQITFFRNRPNVAESNPSAFAPRQLIFAHAAIADPRHGRLRHDQRVARAVFDLAGAKESTTDVWIGDWTLALEGERYAARLLASDFTFDLVFSATQPLLLQGDEGYSRKGPQAGEASWYYSRPHLAVRGAIEVEGRRRDVTGRAWLDHEWSSAYMAEGAVGWDWTGVNLDDGGALMAFIMRDRSGRAVWAGGTLRDAGGRVQRFGPGDVSFTPLRRWKSPRSGVVYPVELELVAGGVRYHIVPMMDDQELDSGPSTGTLYWEGAMTLMREGRRLGRGYLELTGHGDRLRI